MIHANLLFTEINFKLLILNQQRAQKNLMMNMDYIDLVTSIQGMISNPDVCKNTFYDSSGAILTIDATDVTNTSKDVAEIKTSAATSLIKLNQSLNGQSVTKLKLTNIISTGANINSNYGFGWFPQSSLGLQVISSCYF
jgi:hypothetical protein